MSISKPEVFNDRLFGHTVVFNSPIEFLPSIKKLFVDLENKIPLQDAWKNANFTAMQINATHWGYEFSEEQLQILWQQNQSIFKLNNVFFKSFKARIIRIVNNHNKIV